jgi:hypothetical protein
MRNFAAAIRTERVVALNLIRGSSVHRLSHTVTAQAARRVCLVSLGAAGTKDDKLFYQQAPKRGQSDL